MTGTADRIEYTQMAALVAARPDDPSRKALSAALHGINTAERTMREKIAALRAALDDAEAYLDAIRLHADSTRIQHAATDLDRASTARDLHRATAAALLTEAELHQLTTTPAAQ
ncbi:MAG TPA: hypothetical protein VK284_03235 [Streptosporangiaceae bacterium]|nr:hypothetical protein [Streptosporangiaceae bacterium]